LTILLKHLEPAKLASSGCRPIAGKDTEAAGATFCWRNVDSLVPKIRRSKGSGEEENMSLAVPANSRSEPAEAARFAKRIDPLYDTLESHIANGETIRDWRCS